MHTPAFGIDGQHVLVTGASQGIGRAIAETFAACGADVTICSRSMDRIGPVADGINEHAEDTDGAGRALAVECNVRERAAVEAYVAAGVEEFGPVDGLVANAGGEFVSPFDDISENGWDAIVDLNLGGTYRCVQEAKAEMTDGGSIVTLASVNGQHAAPGESPYGAAKAAIIRLTETLAVEYASEGIRVNCIAPGLVQTPGVADTLGIDESDMPPREQVERRIGYPEEIADLAVFLCSPAASFVDGETYTTKGTPRPGNSMSNDLGLQDQ